jgi:autotransporter adhesin
VTFSNGIALGAGSAALATNSVAIGYRSLAEENNTVSIGSEGAERRLVNVADGINSTDSANMGQLNKETTQRTAADAALQDNIDTNTAGIAANTTAIATNTADIAASMAAFASSIGGISANTARIDDLYAITDSNRRQAQRGTAVALALTAAPMPSQAGKTSYTFNLATYRGAQAAGLSLAHRVDSDNPFAITVGASFAGKGDVAARVGVAGEF